MSIFLFGQVLLADVNIRQPVTSIELRSDSPLHITWDGVGEPAILGRMRRVAGPAIVFFLTRDAADDTSEGLLEPCDREDNEVCGALLRSISSWIGALLREENVSMVEFQVCDGGGLAFEEQPVANEAVLFQKLAETLSPCWHVPAVRFSIC